MAVKKRGLGQGLDALITNELEGEISRDLLKDTLKVKISEIEPNREQPRRNFNEDSLQELADSIKQFGVLQPLVVIKRDKYYEIIAGERRWRAAKIAGLKDIPVIVKNFNEEEIIEVSLIENIQRSNLNAIEEAIAYQRLMNEFNLKQDEIADKVSKSRSAIANILRLLNLDSRVQKMIIDEMISSGHARTLLAIEDHDLQYEIATKVFDEKLSVRDIEALIKNHSKNKNIKNEVANKKKEIDANILTQYSEYQKNLTQMLGTKVKIHVQDEKQGKIEIDYYSMEDFERIMELIQNK